MKCVARGFRAILTTFIVWQSLLGLGWAQLRADVYVTGLSSPVAFVQDPSNASVQYVVQQGGRVRVVLNGVLQSTDFLNLAGEITSGGERGLLGVAFPADYAASGRLYVNFTNPQGHTVVARFKRSAGNPLVADPATRFDFLWPGGNLFITQPFANHNGGTLVFGPDGYLYIGLGDGGSGNVPGHRAQDPNTLLGKMLRINVNVPEIDVEGYDVPADNPFVDAMPISALPEIWAFGLRNPWKYSFDNAARGGTGALVIGDVGQNAWEEIDYEPLGAGGRNYGWRNREGAHNNVTNLPAAYLPLTDPIFEYSHSSGVSITGGYVYRGTALGLTYFGRYFFGDLSGKVWSIALVINGATGEATASGLVEHTAELGGAAALGLITSFGEDANGELYIVNYTDGRVLRISTTCPVTFNPLSASFEAAGGTGQVQVTTPCAWTATSNSAFLTVTGGSSGSGDGAVSYAVASNSLVNTPRTSRSGTLTIADRLFTVNQSGCSYSIVPTSTSYDASGGGGTVSVSASAGCTWTAVSNNPTFLSVTGGSSGTGNGTVNYSVGANVGAPNEATGLRSGSLSIAGQTFTVSQSGCTFGIAPTSTTFGSSVGAGAVSVATPSACSWTAAGLPPWATTIAGSTGTGPGTWQYSIAANLSGTSRSQAVLVAGQNFQLTQLAILLNSLVPGTRATFSLASAVDQYWTSIEAVAGRSFCGQVMPDATAANAATPTLTAFRADGTTQLDSGSGADARACFVAPATETELLRVTQSDPGTRQHRLAVVETTLWANWFFIGGDYSSYTILRNTMAEPVTATITWRSQTGANVGVETVAIPSGGVIYREVRAATGGGTLTGSVEIAHDGEPLALLGSHTTLSPTTGLSFDTVLTQRRQR